MRDHSIFPLYKIIYSFIPHQKVFSSDPIFILWAIAEIGLGLINLTNYWNSI